MSLKESLNRGRFGWKKHFVQKHMDVNDDRMIQQGVCTVKAEESRDGVPHGEISGLLDEASQ